MKIIIADDEKLALESLVETIKKVVLDAECYSFQDATELLNFTQIQACQIAFLDIEMREINGIELAKHLKDINPKINLIFVTGYCDYMQDAFSLHASGYLLKPVTKEAIIKELNNLRNPVKQSSEEKIIVQTFGNFDVFYKNTPLKFTRNKSKELFAYLINKCGTSATLTELAAILWEDGLYDRSRQKQIQTFISDLKKSLSVFPYKDIIIKNRTGIMVNKKRIECDYYKFLEGDITAINAYYGEYMNAYSWAEFTTGFLNNKY